MIETADIVAQRYGISREAQDRFSVESQRKTDEGAERPLPRRDRCLHHHHGGHRQGNRRRDPARGHGRRRHLQPARHHLRGAGQAGAGTRGRASSSPPATPRSCPTAPRACVLMEAKEAERAACSRWAPSAAWRWPAASRTKWASARCSRCPSCWQRHGLTIDDIDLWELNEAFASQCDLLPRPPGHSRRAAERRTAARSRSAIRSA